MYLFVRCDVCLNLPPTFTKLTAFLFLTTRL